MKKGGIAKVVTVMTQAIPLSLVIAYMEAQVPGEGDERTITVRLDIRGKRGITSVHQCAHKVIHHEYPSLDQPASQLYNRIVRWRRQEPLPSGIA